MAGWGLIGVEACITVGVTVGVFAVLTLKEPLKIIISATDVAGLVHRIILFFVEIDLLNRSDSLSMLNTSKVGPAVGTTVGELATL